MKRREGLSQRQNLDETQEEWGWARAHISHHGCSALQKGCALCLLVARYLAGRFSASHIFSIWPLGKAGQKAEWVPTPLSCTPVLNAVPVCKAGRGYISWLHVNIAWFLFPLSLHWALISYASASAVQAEKSSSWCPSLFAFFGDVYLISSH